MMVVISTLAQDHMVDNFSSFITVNILSPSTGLRPGPSMRSAYFPRLRSLRLTQGKQGQARQAFRPCSRQADPLPLFLPIFAPSFRAFRRLCHSLLAFIPLDVCAYSNRLNSITVIQINLRCLVIVSVLLRLEQT